MTPTPETKIPFFDLKAQYASLRDELLEASRRVLDSGAFILGPEGAAFEGEFAAAHGVAHCAGVSCGTQALQLALEACGVGKGDKVAVPALTFVATATAVSALGAEPVFVDIDPATLTLDAKDLEKRIADDIKAVIPVHLYGRPADMDAICAVAAARKIPVIEDCAQAHLAEYKGKRVGGIGTMAAFSFYPSKNLGALGDAGAVTTQDEALDHSIRVLRNCGREPKGWYEYVAIGQNSRLDDLQAAFLRVKLKHLSAWTAARRRAAAYYRERLVDIGALRLPPLDPEGGAQVYHLFIVRVQRREALLAHLKEAGIGAGIYYPEPLHLVKAYRHIGTAKGELPEAERACEEILALPMFPELENSAIDRIAEVIRNFYR